MCTCVHTRAHRTDSLYQQINNLPLTGGMESQSNKKLEDSLTPFRATWWMSTGGLLGLVHTTDSWQEGIIRLISKLSTSFLAIYKNNNLSQVSDQKWTLTKALPYLCLNSGIIFHSSSRTTPPEGSCSEMLFDSNSTGRRGPVVAPMAMYSRWTTYGNT